MAKKCLNCGDISDNNLYACSNCLRRINIIRQDIELKRSFKKESLLITNKIAPTFGMLMALLSFIFPFLIFLKFKLSLQICVIPEILYPSLLGFLICLFIGTIFTKYALKFGLELYSDKDYYVQKPIERIKNMRFSKTLLKSVLKICLFSLLGWLTLNIVFLLLAAIFKFRPLGNLLPLRNTIILGFEQSGFFLGLFGSINKYSDWVKGLEK